MDAPAARCALLALIRQPVTWLFLMHGDLDVVSLPSDPESLPVQNRPTHKSCWLKLSPDFMQESSRVVTITKSIAQLFFRISIHSASILPSRLHLQVFQWLSRKPVYQREEFSADAALQLRHTMMPLQPR